MEESLKIFIGILVSLTASCLDALGLNIQKRDHLKASAAVKPRHECLRINWHIGLYLYCGSQAIGNTVALNFLKAQWLAPLGALSLVFNFIFARFLVGTNISRIDLYSTSLILVAIVIIVLLGAFFGPQTDVESDLDLETLKLLLDHVSFKAYFSALNILSFGLFGLGLYTKWFLETGKDSRKSYLFYRIDLPSLNRLFGICIAALGGVFASETLILAKSGIKLILETFKGKQGFGDVVSIAIVVFLVVTAVLQIYCLNASLKFTDSVVAVPVFACTYNIFGLANSMVYFNQFSAYPWWVHLTTVFGIGVLIFGIVIMSKQDKAPPKKIPKLKLKLPKNKFKKDRSKDNYPMESATTHSDIYPSSLAKFSTNSTLTETGTVSSSSYTALIKN